MVKLAVLDIKGKEVENIDLPESIFNGKVNQDVIHQAVVMYQACLREGNASTKTKANVSGGGAKPFRQKGTGRARAGSIRSPLWKKGGVIFGPHPRDFRYSIPKKIKTAALRESLNAKFKTRDLLCLTDITDSIEKTKDFANILKNLKVTGKILAALDGSNTTVMRASRNLPRFNIMRAQDINAYDVLKNKKLLITKSALKKLLERIEK